jgi:hypothetical protein
MNGMIELELSLVLLRNFCTLMLFTTGSVAILSIYLVATTVSE